MEYTPGLHLLTTLYTHRHDLLQHSAGWRVFINEQVKLFGLTEVGQCIHDFPNGGFTAVHCLTESHISVHTWPEYGLCTCDVFLSNFRQDNDATVEGIMQHIHVFFAATRHESQSLRR
ncbi:S-adenosylmethionine decarboxylase [Chitinophaga costaii]|uniref:S-adenosylmethionine decarboxylase n=1 Tax=Chitinophaga costaii TaxID=1335309 RepID=A0A1C4EUN6_9BACT|nr:S-adenosylmethionine decarboxylase [Chitinophaga costaii]PUZ21638.1 S-adenosylmethionine decarboxylase [Chitinophaga costaii]SCC47294.1 S-adenosylmethionine decarboxylase [Chitinophaga costaii]